jgi:hypothetical protein
MRNLDDEDNDYDYSPNELAELSVNNPRLYSSIVGSNVDDGDSISDWQQRNMDWAQDSLAQQRGRNRR